MQDTNKPSHIQSSRQLRCRWIVDWKVGDWDHLATPMASMRYRVLLPMKSLQARGHQVEVVPLQALRNGMALSWDELDVLLIGKLFVDVNQAQFSGDAARLLQAVSDAKRAGVRVLADVNDDHFDRPLAGDYWKALVSEVDLCTVGSLAMGKTVSRHTTRPVMPIGDPLDSPCRPPRVHADRVKGLWARFTQREPLRLVWYGMPNNIAALGPWVQWFGNVWTDMPLQLRVVTSPHPVVQGMVDDFNQRHPKRGHMVFVPWSEEAQWQAVDEADVVLIPADTADLTKAVKTANRLTDALHAGRYVIASPVPSYQPYEAFAALTANPVQALHDYLNDAARARARIAAGQAAVIKDWGMESVASQWLSAMRPPSELTGND